MRHRTTAPNKTPNKKVGQLPTSHETTDFMEFGQTEMLFFLSQV
jgi:hypothetical protein